MIEYFYLIIPVLYAGIQALEFSAVLARVSGIQTGDNMIGYSIQQSVYMCTRLLVVLLLPCLGFAIDRGIEIKDYEILTHMSLLLSFSFGGIVYFFRRSFVEYYTGVIRKYKLEGGFVRAFWGNSRFRIEGEKWKSDRSGEGWRLMVISTVVFSIYAVGIFASFYGALLFFDYRATIAQLSGVVNAAAAVLLTFYVEPVISKKIDGKSEGAVGFIMCLFVGRMFAVAAVAQLMLFSLFYFSK